MADCLSALVQRQLGKVRVAANEWVLFWLRLALRASLAWRSFGSRAAKMASSLSASFVSCGDAADRGMKAHGVVVFDEASDQAKCGGYKVSKIVGDATRRISSSTR